MSDTTLSCGCDVSLGRSGLCSRVYKDSAWISQCRLHKAAPELLEALKELLFASAGLVEDKYLRDAREAIAKVEGK